MQDISNRTLVMLTALAIIFSLFGVTTILGRLGQPFPLITGFSAVEQANVTVTVATVLSIDATSNVTFGNGSNVNGVILTTNESQQPNPSTFAEPGDFRIENDGNVDVNVSINSSRASLFITSGTAPLYNWSGTNATNDNGCTGVDNLTTANTAFGVGAQNVTVCDNLTYRNAADSVNVSVWVFVPQDTAPGTYSANVFFMAQTV